MKKSLLNKRTNSEYFRTPQNAKSGYQLAQRSISEKLMQVKYGPFAESEHQKPYESPDEDYQGLESNYTPFGFVPYTPPGFPTFPTPKPPPATEDGCFALWKKMFGDWAGGVIDAVKGKLLVEYVKRCPIEFIPRICCGTGLRLIGPDTYVANSVTNLRYYGGRRDCSYYIEADRGKGTARFDGGTSGVFKYTAPSTAGKDTITLSPWLSEDDRMTPCISKDVTITSPSCGTGKIGYTSQQMTGSTTQQLTVTTPQAGSTYTWEVTSGGGTISETGLYTAPVSNPNCTNNPTISLKVGTDVCDTLVIAISIVTDDYSAVYDWHDTRCTVYNPNLCNCYVKNYAYNCLGNLRAGYPCEATKQLSTTPAPCSVCFNTPYPGSCGATNNSINQLIAMSPIDLRNSAQKTAGCCPQQLL